MRTFARRVLEAEFRAEFRDETIRVQLQIFGVNAQKADAVDVGEPYPLRLIVFKRGEKIAADFRRFRRTADVETEIFPGF